MRIPLLTCLLAVIAAGTLVQEDLEKANGRPGLAGVSALLLRQAAHGFQVSSGGLPAQLGKVHAAETWKPAAQTALWGGTDARSELARAGQPEMTLERRAALRRGVQLAGAVVGVACSAPAHANELTGTTCTLTVTISGTETAKLEIALRPDWAPLAVGKFQALVRRGFYDDLTFSHVVPNFITQSGRDGGPPVLYLGVPDDPFVDSKSVFTKDHTFGGDERFAPIGEVTKGLDVAERIFAGRVQDLVSQGRVQRQDSPYEQALQSPWTLGGRVGTFAFLKEDPAPSKRTYIKTAKLS